LVLFFPTVLFITFLNKALGRKPEMNGLPLRLGEGVPGQAERGAGWGGHSSQALLLKPSLIYKEDGWEKL
jgi:hypothetical protein